MLLTLPALLRVMPAGECGDDGDGLGECDATMLWFECALFMLCSCSRLLLLEPVLLRLCGSVSRRMGTRCCSDEEVEGA